MDHASPEGYGPSQGRGRKGRCRTPSPSRHYPGCVCYCGNDALRIMQPVLVVQAPRIGKERLWLQVSSSSH